MNKDYPIGIFDSGVGGLSVVNEIIRLLPDESLIYYADNANCPYGPREPGEILAFSKTIVDFFLTHHVKLVVVACNTATAAAIEELRNSYPIPFVGIEPAVKPAAKFSRSGKIGILATEGTFSGKLFKETSARYATSKDMNIQVGKGLVEKVEAGEFDTEDTVRLLKNYIEPMITDGVDQLVLGCTHYPFLMDAIKRISGNKMQIIDPAPAVAKQVKNILQHCQLLNTSRSKPVYRFYTSGKSNTLHMLLKKMQISVAELEEKNIHKDIIP